MTEILKNIPIEGRIIAVNITKATKNVRNILWLGGYLSDMFGTKASYLQNYAQNNGAGFIRFDFSYTALSQQNKNSKELTCPENSLPVNIEFLEANLSKWLVEAKYIYEKFIGEDGIIVASSCGGWIGLLLAKLVKLHSLILIAPAPDFTTKLSGQFKDEDYLYIREAENQIALPFSRNFIEDAEKHLLLSDIIDIDCEIHIFQGGKDDIVSLNHSLELMYHLPKSNVKFTYQKDADHGFSRAEDLKLIELTLDDILFR